MIISSIVAVTKNEVIGKDNGMPWHLPADLAYFKKITLDHYIILGRKNFLSIGKPLPRRTNIILTKDPKFACSNCLVSHSIEEALDLAMKANQEEVFIIGGGSIYSQSVKYWDKLYLTEIDAIVEGDVFFPEIDWSEWNLTEEEFRAADDKNKYDMTFKVYDRK